MDPAYSLSEKDPDPGFRQVPEETVAHFLLGPQDSRLGAEQDQPLVDPNGPLLATVKRHNRLSRTILQETLQSGRRCSRQRKCRTDNIRATWFPATVEKLTTPISAILMFYRFGGQSRCVIGRTQVPSPSSRFPPSLISRNRLLWTLSLIARSKMS